MNQPIIQQGDREAPRSVMQLPLVLVLDFLRSAHNVGNIFRIAEATRVEKIYACGYTPCPPHSKLLKTARGCEQTVPCQSVADAASALTALRAAGYTIYGIETASNASYYWETAFRFPAAFVLGNEALGLCESTLAQCDFFVSLPVLGQKNSINVGNCAAVVVYEALRQWLDATPGSLNVRATQQNQ